MKNAQLFVAIICFFCTGMLFSQTNPKEKQAIALYEHKKLEEAKVLFRKVLLEEPNNANVQEYLANIAFDQKKYKLAASKIKILVEKYPNVARYHFKYAGSMGVYAKDNKLKSIFLIDDIKKHFHKAVDLDNTFVDAYLGLVHLYTELPSIFGGSDEKALSYAKKVASLSAKAGEDAMNIIINAR